METTAILQGRVPPHIPWGMGAGKEEAVSVTLTGVAASPGTAEGPCAVIRSLEDLRAAPHGAILVCEVPWPALGPYMHLLRGLVAGRGGPNCIAAGYAREHGVPAVMGTGGAMDAIRDGDVIRIDGGTGTVEVIG